MDVIGAGGPLGSRQLLTAQSQAAQTQAAQATKVDRSGQQPARTRTSVQSVQETASAAPPQSGAETGASRTVQRAGRSVSAADIQNRENPLPRGSLVNILV